MTRQLKRFSLVVLIGFSGWSVADTLNPAQVSLMAASCANCHGTDGRKVSAIPAIAGRPAEILEQYLLAFKHDPNTSATVMNRLAKGYSDDELRAMARYFSAIQ